MVRCVLSAAACLVLVTCTHQPPPASSRDAVEDATQGQDVTARVEELVEILGGTDAAAKIAAAEALAAIGPPAGAAVPALHEASDHENADVRRAAVDALLSIGSKVAIEAYLDLVSTWNPGEVEKQKQALVELGTRAVAPLVDLLKDYSVAAREFAVDTLARIGPKAIPQLVEALVSQDPLVRSCAAQALGRMGPEADSAIPALMGVLGDGNVHVVENAARAISEIHPGDEDLVQSLSRLVGDADLPGQAGAALALGHMGPEAAAACPGLEIALGSPQPDVRIAAALALGAVACTGTEPDLASLLDEGSEQSWAAAMALGMLGTQVPDEVIETLASMAVGPDPNGSTAAVWALGRAGGGGKDAIEALVSAVENDASDLGILAAEALGETGTLAIPPALGLLEHPDPQVRASATRILAKIADGSTVEALLSTLGDEYPDVRGGAIVALGAIGPAAAVPPLIECLGILDTFRHVVDVEMETLDPTSPHWSYTVHMTGSIHDAAQKALVAIGEAAVKPLIEAAKNKGKSPFAEKPAYARETLVVMGKQAVPVLLEALETGDEETRDIALEALEQIDPSAVP